jgi:uncharacterized protein (TIGR00159 family)
MVSQVFQAGLTAALVGLVIIFQNDIRMFAERLAMWDIFHTRHASIASNKTVEALIDSLCSLAKDKIGALVVVRGKESLDRHLSGGISLNGRLSLPLIYSIFHPSTPCHDGAIIIEGDRIEKFGVRLPLSHNISEIGNKGTRHSAALGLAERSDALILVVSEERGVVSVAEKGHLSVVNREELSTRAKSFYQNLYPAPTGKFHHRWITDNTGLKIFSLSIAIILWFFFAYRIDTVNRTITIPLEFRNVPTGWIVEDPRPTEVKISLSGPERAFNFNSNTLVASLDMSTISEGHRTLPISELNLNLPSGIMVNQISPNTFSFNALKMVQIELPLRVKTSGSMQNDLSIEQIRLNPSTVKVLIPEQRKNIITELTTESVDLRLISQSTTIRQKIIIPAGVQLLDDKQSTVQIVIVATHKRPAGK